MKTVIILCLALLLAAVTAWAGVDAIRWNAARTKFLKEYKDPAKVIDAVKELAALDDYRAAELLSEKTLFHEKYTVRKATFDALAATKDSKAVEYLAEEVRRQTDPAKRIVFVKLLRYFTGDSVVRNVQRALQDKKWEIVVSALEAASTLKDKALIPDLKKLLDNPNPRIAFESSEILSALGEDVPERFRVGQRIGLFPDKIFSDKVILVLDGSYDMDTKMSIPREDIEEILKKEAQQKEKEQPKPQRKEEKEPPKEDEKTRKEREEKEYVAKFVRTRISYAAEKLANAVKSLPAETRVNVITFGVSISKWLKSAEKLTKKEYEKLESFLLARTTPARDTYSVLKAALAEEGVDTIYFVSCGLPAGVALEDTSKILGWLSEENFTRCIRIHTVAILSDYEAGNLPEDAAVRYRKRVDEIRKFLKDLAEDNGGTFFCLDAVGKVEIPRILEPGSEKEPPAEKKPSENGEEKEEQKK